MKKMNKYGLIGSNISYSVSKLLHEEIARLNNLEYEYEIIDIKVSQLAHYIELLKKGVYQGFNVTIPFKEKVIPYVDRLTTKAKQIKVVNTLYYQNGKVVGDNTDYYGFLKMLRVNNIFNKGYKKAYILGSGGAAKAVYLVLKEKGFDCVVVALEQNAYSYFEKVITYEDFESIKDIELLINATPVGTYPSKEAVIKPTGKSFKMIIDLIYNPLTTTLMSYAKNHLNGLEMLIFQAIKAQELWQNKVLLKGSKSINKIKEVLVNELIRKTI